VRRPPPPGRCPTRAWLGVEGPLRSLLYWVGFVWIHHSLRVFFVPCFRYSVLRTSIVWVDFQNQSRQLVLSLRLPFLYSFLALGVCCFISFISE
jgi:hypothetical protein